MCSYTKQVQEIEDAYLRKKVWLMNNNLPLHTEWLEDSMRPKNHRAVPVIGIGNFGNIMAENIQTEEGYLWIRAKFGPSRELFPGKALTYYNAKVEKLEQYESGEKKSKFAKEVLEDLELRSAVFWVNSFFESNGNKSSPRWFHIYRKDEQLIPLAAFYHKSEPKEGSVERGFTIVTRDPYELVQETGHKRSPGVLRYQDVKTWLSPQTEVGAKLGLLANDPQGEYVIDEVERYSVTKRTDHAHEPIEGGQYFVTGSLN